MEKNIRDYLPFYIGQFVHIENYGTFKLVAFDRLMDCIGVKSGTSTRWIQMTQKLKIILRKLESMTKEELRDWIELGLRLAGESMSEEEIQRYLKESLEDIRQFGLAAFEFSDENVWQVPHLFHYLLSKGFDLWNLIDEHLAIDKATLKINA